MVASRLKNSDAGVVYILGTLTAVEDSTR